MVALSLLDIKPQTQEVYGLEVHGLSADDIAILLAKFPAFQSLATMQSVKAQDLIAIAPDSLATIVAMACGYRDDDAAEEKARTLPIGAQFDIIEAVGG